MRKLIFIFFFITAFAIGQTATLESYGGTANNMGVDNHSAMSAALNDHRLGVLDTLTLTGGSYYNFDTQIGFFETVADFTVIATGTGRATITSDNLTSLWRETQDFVGPLRFESIKFECTTSSVPPNLSEASIMFFYNANQSNIYIEDCEFTAPNTETNAIKFYTTPGKLIQTVRITNTYIHDIGRMAIESVVEDATPRGLTDVTVQHCQIDDTGLIGIGSGMGTSWSGWAEKIRVKDNTFHNNKICALEDIGTDSLNFSRNTITGTGSPMHFVAGSGVIRNTNNTIEDNVSNTTLGNWYYNVTNLVETNNSWTMGDRMVQAANIVTSSFNNNTYDITVVTGSAAFWSGSDKTGNFTFNDCIIKVNSNVTFTGPVPPHAWDAEVILNCSDIDVVASGNFDLSNTDYTVTDVDKYIGGVFSEELNDTAPCSASRGYSDAAIAVTSLTWDNDTQTVNDDELLDLSYTFVPVNATDQGYSLSSSNTGVVNNSGIVVGVGTSNLTITADDTTNGTISDIMAVTVVTPAIEITSQNSKITIGSGSIGGAYLGTTKIN